jgi:hypothetical protein
MKKQRNNLFLWQARVDDDDDDDDAFLYFSLSNMWGARERRDKRGGERERGSYLSLRYRKGTAGELARRRKKLYFLLWFALISFLSVTISFFCYISFLSAFFLSFLCCNTHLHQVLFVESS